MDLLKKNPVFSALCGLFLVIFIAGVVLIFTAQGKLSKTKKTVASSEREFRNALALSPAPTPENVKASEANLAALTQQFEAIQKDLQRGSKLTTSNDQVRVMSMIQQFISDYQRKARATAESGDAEPIKIADDFAFGFEKYLNVSDPADPAAIPLLDKQRQILSYILDQLIAANPQSLEKVERELVEETSSDTGAVSSRSARRSKQEAGFQINPLVSARVPDAINTMAFSVTFNGYTDSLRQFLNNLSSFDLPVVVRSVSVERKKDDKPTQVTSNTSGLDSIFGSFGGASEPTEPQQAAEKPVVSENQSSFTVVLEFIEIVSPSESVEDNS